MKSVYLQSYECVVCVYLWNCLPMLHHRHLFINKYYHVVLFNLLLDIIQADSCKVLWSMAKFLPDYVKLQYQRKCMCNSGSSGHHLKNLRDSTSWLILHCVHIKKIKPKQTKPNNPTIKGTKIIYVSIHAGIPGDGV